MAQPSGTADDFGGRLIEKTTYDWFDRMVCAGFEHERHRWATAPEPGSGAVVAAAPSAGPLLRRRRVRLRRSAAA